MKIRIYDEYGALNSLPVFDAFRRGLDHTGDSTTDRYDDADVVVLWSILFSGRMAPGKRIWKKAHADKKACVVLEVGALNRGESWKVGINGINRKATWAKPFEENRFDKFGIDVKPWKDDGEFITICTQRPDSTQWPEHITIEKWVTDQIKWVHEMEFNRPIVIRPHPRDKHTKWDFLNQFNNIFFDPPQLIQGTYDSFNHNETFDRSWLVMNHSSGPGVQAVLDGTNVVVSEDSLAFDMDFRKQSNPDRTQWLNMLAHTEWFVDEIAQGTPWQALKNSL